MTPEPSNTASWAPPPPPSSKPTQVSSKRGSYSNTNNFNTNMAIILIILACAAVLAFSLHAAGRLLLRLLSLRRSSPSTDKPKFETPSGALSPALFSAGTRLARTEAECAICLSEFAEGERVRVLPNCGHGFHANCVEEWIVARSSCPTCRAPCRFHGATSVEP